MLSIFFIGIIMSISVLLLLRAFMTITIHIPHISQDYIYMYIHIIPY